MTHPLFLLCVLLSSLYPEDPVIKILILGIFGLWYVHLIKPVIKSIVSDIRSLIPKSINPEKSIVANTIKSAAPPSIQRLLSIFGDGVVDDPVAQLIFYDGGSDKAHNPSWLDLPTEVLLMICEKLINIEDYIRFGAVCSGWRTILWHSCKAIPPQRPLLMILHSKGYSPANGHMYTHSFFSSRGFHEGALHDTEYSYYYGSTHGWLVKRDTHTDEGIFQLVNPFLSTNNVITLPSLGKGMHLHKVVLSHNPSLTSNYVVMVIYSGSGIRNMLAFLKPGDRIWNIIIWGLRMISGCYDIAYCNDHFYALCMSGELVSCEITNSECNTTKFGTFPQPIYDDTNTRDINYLVKVSEELVCVRRVLVDRRVDDDYCSSTIGFQVLKFMTNTNDCTELQTLGEYAIFIGSGFSTSLLASDFPQIKPSHIYFSDHSDSGVFNLVDASFHVRVSRISCGLRSAPVWVQPTLNMVGSAVLPKHKYWGKYNSIKGFLLSMRKTNLN